MKIKQITEWHPVDIVWREKGGLGRGDREAERWIHQTIRVLSLIRTLMIFYIL